MPDDITKTDAVFFGLLNTFGRFQLSDLKDSQQAQLKTAQYLTYYDLGQASGIIIRAVATTIVVYLTTSSLQGALISMLTLVGVDTVATSGKVKS